MRKIVQKNEVSIMKLSARRGLECRILHHLSQSFWAVKDGINLLATFQFSPATSKSNDIPGCADKLCDRQDKNNMSLHQSGGRHNL